MPLLPHHWERRLRGVNHPKEIGLDNLVEFLERRIFDRTDIAVARIIGQHVQSAKGIPGNPHRIESGGCIRHVQINQMHLIAVFSLQVA